MKRKLEHIEYALKTGQQNTTGLEDITFVHNSLPEMSLDEASLETKMGELLMSSPIFINAMTGGGGQETERINRDFAIAARETGISLAVGSQMAALRDTTQTSTYSIIRKENPNGILFGNLGSEATVEDAKRAVSMIEADALQIHLNVIQELVMPEGDRDFTGMLRRIENICASIDVPVIVKEVGFGMSKKTVSSLVNVGVQMIDVGGFGGTNFATIENERRARILNYFNSWGITTAASIVEASVIPDVNVFASGGIQNGLDVAKCLALGADAVGIAGYFLKIYQQKGLQALINEIQMIHEDLTIIMTALGIKKISDFRRVEKVIHGETFHWLSQRNLIK